MWCSLIAESLGFVGSLATIAAIIALCCKLLHDARLCFQAGCTGYLLNVVLFLCATPFGILSGGKYVYLASCIVYAAVAFAVKHAALRNMVRIQ